jgi:acyl dehydratase
MTEPIVVERIATGDLLPPLAIPVTTSAIVAGALASSDFEVVHHDRTAAQQRGTPDIFLNILTTNGYVQRFVNGWTGRGGAIRSVELRLGVPSYPGDTLKLTGTVRGKQQVGAEQIVEVAVRGANSLGEHVAAIVRVALP